jgi:4-amino-4-deoxy-L-arabinose transferase-like glycosyltransferase
VFGPGKAVGVLLQTGLGVATCFLLAAIGSSAFGLGTGRAAALLLAAYPNHVVYSTLHLTEPLSTFLLLLAVFLSLRPNSLLAVGATGVVIGLASLVRPLFILLPGALAIWYWRIVPGRAGALLRTAMVGLFTVLAVSPWVIRNHAVTGRWLTLSTNGGRVFWMGNYPGAFGGYKHDREINNKLRVGDSLNYDEGYRLGMDAILDAPVEAGVRIVRKLTYLVALETDGVLWNLKGLERTTPLWSRLLLLGLANACYLAVVPFAILGVLRGPRRDPLATMLVVLAGLSFVTAAIFLGDPRYHYALIPLACLFAIKGVADDLPQLLRHDPSRSAGRPVWATWALSTGVFAAMVVANAVIKVVEVRTLGS